MNLTEIGKTAAEINGANGFPVFTKNRWPWGHDFEKDKAEKAHLLATHMALIHSEESEATEALRKGDRNNFEEELADVIIRVASIAHGLGIDLERTIVGKLEVNKTRGFRHGGKLF